MKKKYFITGFDCAHCASEAEEELNKEDKISKCTINYAASLMTIEYKDEPISSDALEKMIYGYLNEDVKVKEKEESSDYHSNIYNKKILFLLIRIVICAVLLVLGMIFQFVLVKEKYDPFYITMMVLYLVGYVIISYDILIDLVKSLKNPKSFFGKSTLMEIASIGALAIQNYMEAVMVVFLGQIGELIEDISVQKSKNIIIDTIDLRSKTSLKVFDDRNEEVDTRSLIKGDEVILKIGESVPSDGIIIEGEGEFDTSSLTGEFEPLIAKEGEEILSGYILKEGNIKIKLTKDYKDSTTSKILDLVIESGENKTKAEKFISKFAKFYTPIMFFLALALALIPPIIIGSITKDFSWNNTWYKWVYYALTLLVIACPCAILISVPLAYFSGVGLASKYGILIKGTNYLDRINDIKKIVLDKTGTLTKGKFSIVDKNVIGISEDDFDSYFVIGEEKSNHPLARAIRESLSNKSNFGTSSKYEVIEGHGVKCLINENVVFLVNESYVEKIGINFKKGNDVTTNIYLVINNVCYGYISLEDTIKDSSKNLISYLNKKDIDVLMLTGAKEKSARFAANSLQIQHFYSDLLPNQKTEILKKEIENKEKKSDAIAFVGDGVNDAPSIMLSDVGYSMGSMGSDVAVDNSDVVIMNDDPLKIAESFEIAKHTRIRAIIDILVALLIKLSIMVLSLPEINIVKDMWIAVLVDSGLSVLLIIFSILLIKKKIKIK